MGLTKWQVVVVACFGIACFTILTAVSIFTGVDGVLRALGFSGIATIVAGTVGYKLHRNNKG